MYAYKMKECHKIRELFKFTMYCLFVIATDFLYEVQTYKILTILRTTKEEIYIASKIKITFLILTRYRYLSHKKHVLVS